MNYPFPKQPNESQMSEEQQLLQLLQTNPELYKQYQEQVEKLKNQSSSSNPPMNSDKYLSQLSNIAKYLDPEGGLLIQPKERFVLKFFQKRTNQKIFVNIVSHPVIDHPQEKLLVDFENQPGLRIPMSMGRVREDSDKNGAPCKVVDVVLNPKIIETMQSDPGIMAFTAQIIGNYLLEKYKIVVSEDKMKKVKGLKYKGNRVEIQRVKGKKSPKIEQISEEKTPEQQNKEQQLLNQINNPSQKQLIKPQFKIWAYESINGWEEYSIDSNKNLQKLKIVFELPHLLNSKGIHLEGSSRFLYLLVRGIYEVCLKLPFDIGKHVSKFGRKERKLEIVMYPMVEKEQNSEAKVKKEGKQVKVEFENDLLDELV